MSSRTVSPFLPPPVPIPIHTLPQLLALLHSRSYTAERPVVDIFRLDSALRNIRENLERAILDRTGEPEWYVDMLDVLADMEELAIEGWCRWAEGMEQMRAFDERLSGLVGELDADADVDGVGDSAAGLPDRGDEDGGVVKGSHSTSTVVEIGSLMSGRTGRRRRDREYPSFLVGPESSEENGNSDEEVERHARQERGWNREEAERRQSFSIHTEGHQSPLPHSPGRHDAPGRSPLDSRIFYASTHYPIGPYVHILLPAGFQFGGPDRHFIFTGTSSVFHFPHGATKDQVHALLCNLRESGRSTPHDQVSIISVGHDQESFLKIDIAEVLGLEDVESLWDTEGRGIGQTYISPQGAWKSYKKTVEVTGIARTEIEYEDGMREVVETESGDENEEGRDVEDIALKSDGGSKEEHQAHLRGGNGESSLHDHPGREIGNTPFYIDSPRQLKNTKDFSWMQEAHILRINLADLEYWYEQLRQDHAEALETIETDDRRMKGVFRRMGYWIDEARDAKRREEEVKRELLDKIRVFDAYEEAASRMEDAERRVHELCNRVEEDLDKKTGVPDRSAGIRGGGPSPSPTEKQGFMTGPAEADFKHWTGPPSASSNPSSPTSPTSPTSYLSRSRSISAPVEPSISEPLTSAISATAFYFFPSVSTIALLTDPMHYFQWEHPTTLPQIRQFLSERKDREIEDNAMFVRIREILQIRDEIGVPDPDCSLGKMVLVSMPTSLSTSEVIEMGSEGVTPAWDKDKEELKTAEKKELQSVLLEAINLLRANRGMPSLNLELGSTTDSEDEPRHRDIGHLINTFNGDVDASSDYDSQPESASSYENHTEPFDASPSSRLQYRNPFTEASNDRKPSNSTISHLELSPRSLPQPLHPTIERRLTPPPEILPETLPIMFPTSTSTTEGNNRRPRRASTSLPPSQARILNWNSWHHPKGQGCETWTAHLDPRRDRCTFCHLPFVEITPIRNRSEDSSLEDDDFEDVDAAPRFPHEHLDSTLRGGAVQGPTSPSGPFKAYNDLYINSPTGFNPSRGLKHFLSTDCGQEDYMSASYPFKVCTNPYACPPVHHTCSRSNLNFQSDSAPSTPPGPPQVSASERDTMASSRSSSPGSGERRDWYRREAEEFTVEERIAHIELLVTSLIKITREFAASEQGGIKQLRHAQHHDEAVASRTKRRNGQPILHPEFFSPTTHSYPPTYDLEYEIPLEQVLETLSSVRPLVADFSKRHRAMYHRRGVPDEQQEVLNKRIELAREQILKLEAQIKADEEKIREWEDRQRYLRTRIARDEEEVEKRTFEEQMSSNDEIVRHLEEHGDNPILDKHTLRQLGQGHLDPEPNFRPRVLEQKARPDDESLTTGRGGEQDIMSGVEYIVPPPSPTQQSPASDQNCFPCMGWMTPRKKQHSGSATPANQSSAIPNDTHSPSSLRSSISQALERLSKAREAGKARIWPQANNGKSSDNVRQEEGAAKTDAVVHKNYYELLDQQDAVEEIDALMVSEDDVVDKKDKAVEPKRATNRDIKRKGKERCTTPGPSEPRLRRARIGNESEEYDGMIWGKPEWRKSDNSGRRNGIWMN